MTECRNPELQDLLPDYLSESLGDADRMRVAAHVSACAACDADLVLLRQVRAARMTTAGRAAPIDIARIVAALPAPPARVAQPLDARPAFTLHTNPPSVTEARPARSTRRAVQGTALWRIAAVLGVIAAGGMSVAIARRGIEAVQGTALSAENVAVVADTPSSMIAAAPAESGHVAVPTTGASVPVSYGDLGNYSEDELKAMLDRLDKWDGASSAEPMPTLPLVAVRGGSLQ